MQTEVKLPQLLNTFKYNRSKKSIIILVIGAIDIQITSQGKLSNGNMDRILLKNHKVPGTASYIPKLMQRS